MRKPPATDHRVTCGHRLIPGQTSTALGQCHKTTKAKKIPTSHIEACALTTTIIHKMVAHLWKVSRIHKFTMNAKFAGSRFYPTITLTSPAIVNAVQEREEQIR